MHPCTGAVTPPGASSCAEALVQTAVQFADAHCAVFEPELGEHKLECATSGVASDTREVLLQICLYSFCMLFAPSGCCSAGTPGYTTNSSSFSRMLVHSSAASRLCRSLVYLVHFAPDCKHGQHCHTAHGGQDRLNAFLSSVGATPEAL